MQNDYPRYPQNFQSRIPLAGYEWYSSRLIRPRLSGFIFDDAITLPVRMSYNSAERVIFNQIHFPMLEWLCLIGVEQRSSYPQTRQSLGAAITWDLKTTLLCEFGVLGTPWPKGMVPAWAAAWLRDYDIGCWYEAYCIPAHWRVRIGNCNSLSFRYGRARVI